MYKRNQSLRLKKELYANKRTINQLQKTVEMQGKRIAQLSDKTVKLDKLIDGKLNGLRKDISKVLILMDELREHPDLPKNKEIEVERDSDGDVIGGSKSDD